MVTKTNNGPPNRALISAKIAKIIAAGVTGVTPSLGSQIRVTIRSSEAGGGAVLALQRLQPWRGWRRPTPPAPEMVKVFPWSMLLVFPSSVIALIRLTV